MTTTAPARPATRRDPLMIGIRVLLGLFGAFKLYGTLYFTFLATVAEGGDPQNAFDWFVAAWSFSLATALIVAALRLGSADHRTVLVTSGLLAVEVVFSIVKLFVYDEPEALGFMAMDVVLLVLLAVATRRRRAA